MRLSFSRIPYLFFIIPILVLIVLLVYVNLALGQKEGLLFFLKSHPGSCLILQEKYCQKVEFIPNPMSPDGVVAAFKLPKGATLFSPADGAYSDASFNLDRNKSEDIGAVYPGATILVSEDRNFLTAEGIYTFIYFGDQKRESKPEIKKGEILGTISDKNVDYFGDYNLVFSVSKYFLEGGLLKTANDAERLESIFGKNN